jgi:exosortase A-associated hydrolase 1
MIETNSIPVSFACLEHTLFGILESPECRCRLGVVIVVGGPQYRAGSHRQFVLLCRYLARNGIPSFRFDHRGVGDSEGATTFESMDADIRSAIDEFMQLRPDVSDVVLWGLCDAASAIMMYAPTDARVAGLVVLNPWVRSETTLAKAYLKEMSLRDVFDKQRWIDLLRGRKSLKTMAASVFDLMRTAYGRAGGKSPGNRAVIPDQASGDFRDRMLAGVRAFSGSILLILSGKDITAREFEALVADNDEWKELLSRETVTSETVPEATHTFSQASWREQVERWTCDWARNLTPYSD